MRRYRTIVALTAGAVVLIGGAFTASGFLGSGHEMGSAQHRSSDRSPEPLPAARPAGTVQNATSQRTGPLPTPGVVIDCAETYTPEAVAQRAFAFDGIITEIGPSRTNRPGTETRPDLGYVELVAVTFSVEKWYAGGTGPTVTVDMYPPTLPGETPDIGPAAYAIGSRLLISGESRWGGAPLDAPIAWGCGFSRYYDPQTAQSWR